MKFPLIALLLLGFNSLFSQTIPSWKSKVDPDILTAYEQGVDKEYIILFSAQANLSRLTDVRGKNEKSRNVFDLLQEQNRSTQKNLIQALSKRGISSRSLTIVNAVLVNKGIELLPEIASGDNVKYIYANRPIKRAETFDDTLQSDRGGDTGITWGIEKMRVDKVWEMGIRGKNVVVGGQDTGYKWDHPALKKAYRGYNDETETADHNYNWHDAIHEFRPEHGDTLNPCGLDNGVPCDDNGHGTHTMGTMIGLDASFDQQIGLAPEAEWCGCRNMERGWGTLFTYLECFEWFLAPTDLEGLNPDPAKAPHVINNSWGCPEVEGCTSENWDIMDIAVNNLRAAGIVVVVSAGNDGSQCETVRSPAAIFENSFSIGATAENDTIAGFSSRGAVTVDSSFRIKPNVSAPGVRVRSARLNDGYGNSSGTSMAGPHVAGLVALMISANPHLEGEVELIENIIEASCIPRTTDQSCNGVSGDEIPNNTYGFGRVNALAAVEAALLYIPSSDEHIEQLNVFIAPNPVSELLTISISEGITKGYVAISDIQGRMRYQFKPAADTYKMQLDFSDLEPGVYVLLLENDGKRFRRLIVRQ